MESLELASEGKAVMHPIIECDEQIRQLENIIRTATRYGDDVSYYEKELSKMKSKRIELEEAQHEQPNI